MGPRVTATALLLWLRLAGQAQAEVEDLAEVHACPSRCICQRLFPSLGTLCNRRGLLFVPLGIDQGTVELHLADNFIETIGPDDFFNMSSLVDLTLSRNAIGHLAPEALRDLGGLNSLHLDGNRLKVIGAEDLRGLYSLVRLRVNNNQLSQIATEAFLDLLYTLEDLDLSYNNLLGLPWDSIARMENLHSLSLEHNLLEEVSPRAFEHLLFLARLDLASNRLQRFAAGPRISSLHLSSLALTLGGNPLHCSCELRWLKRRMKAGDVETCASPPYLRGRYLMLTPEYEMECTAPSVIQQTARHAAQEGGRIMLSCRVSGDPPPVVRWLGPGGLQPGLDGNSTRRVVRPDGSLEIRVVAPADDGTFACEARNVAGSATAYTHLSVLRLPQVPINGRVGMSTIGRTATTRPGMVSYDGNGHLGTRKEVVAVRVNGVTAVSAVVAWVPVPSAKGVQMYQIHYNCSSDEPLVYRMVDSSEHKLVVKQLAPGSLYDLCVIALGLDSQTKSATSWSLGCTRFTTRTATTGCRSQGAEGSGDTHAGATVVLGIAAIIVFSLLTFIVAYIVRNRAALGCPTRRLQHRSEDLKVNGTTSVALTFPSHPVFRSKHCSNPQKGSSISNSSSCGDHMRDTSAWACSEDCSSSVSPLGSSSTPEMAWPVSPPVNHLLKAFTAIDFASEEIAKVSHHSDSPAPSDRAPLLGIALATPTTSHHPQRLPWFLTLHTPGNRTRRSRSFEPCAGRQDWGLSEENRLGKGQSKMATRHSVCLSSEWVMESTV
uniref:leucine-rich repeat and fibronectin type-III domain-containing protein 4-like n=1 Tax=Myxine glutinosa TaxID=7769 RepID=UPI00358E9BD1